MNPIASRSNTLSRAFHFIFNAALLAALALTLTPQTSRADSATWTGNSTGDVDYWYNPDNWNPETVPNDPADTATFAVSDQTELFMSFVPGVGNILFEPAGSSYNLNLSNGTFALSGAGISNNSGVLQNFDIRWVCYSCGGGLPNSIEFHNTATAGQLTVFTTEPSVSDDSFGGQLVFWDSSTAGSAVINNLGANIGCSGGATYFEGDSSAENAIITNDGSTVGCDITAGLVFFDDNSTAGHATIINNAALSEDGQGGLVWFSDSSDSGDSTIICHGDTLGSRDRPAAVWFDAVNRIDGRARVILLGNGELLSIGVVAVGSVEGNGVILLDQSSAGMLTVGTNNRSTTFAGLIQDSGSFSGGSIRKVGRGILTLTGANTYAGKTSIEAGELRVNNTEGSGTGTGPVRVNDGILSGRGTIAGPVTVGTGAGAVAFLAPGDVKAGTLTIQSAITFNADATYSYNMNTRNARADELVANGVTINAAAVFSVSASGHGQLPIGTVLTAINNTSETSIAGAFSNLADGAIISANGNNLQASYSGGDGNDLTLTVVP